MEEKVFKCFLCGLEEKFEFYGKRVEFAKNVGFKEDTYVMRDPFSPRHEGLFLSLGSNCSKCEKTVCNDLSCSVFWKKRYCKDCAKSYARELPDDLSRRLSASNVK